MDKYCVITQELPTLPNDYLDKNNLDDVSFKLKKKKKTKKKKQECLELEEKNEAPMYYLTKNGKKINKLAYLTRRGYTIFKKDYSEKKLQKIKDELTVKPFVPPDYSIDEPKQFAVYLESNNKLYLPRFFGISRLGDITTSNFRLEEGKCVNMAFNGKLRPMQLDIISYMIKNYYKQGGGILSVGCGVGKTVISLWISAHLTLLLYKYHLILVSLFIEKYLDADENNMDYTKIENEAFEQLKSYIVYLNESDSLQEKKNIQKEIKRLSTYFPNKFSDSLSKIESYFSNIGLCNSLKHLQNMEIDLTTSKKTLVVVHKEFLVNQWKERIQTFLPNVNIGIIQRDKVDIQDKDIVISMLHSVAMKDYDPQIFEEFGHVIYDEAHHLSAEVFSQALPKTACKYLLGLSATPHRKDGLTKVFEWYIGDIAFSMKRKNTGNVVINNIYFECNDPGYCSEKKNISGKLNMPAMINNIVSHSKRNRLIHEIHKILLDDNRNVLTLSGRRNHLVEMKNIIETETNYEGGFYMGGMKEEELAESEKKPFILGTFNMACLDKETIIQDGITGVEYRMDELYQNRIKLNCLNFKKDRFELVSTGSFGYAPDKSIYKIHFETGSLILSGDHKVLTNNGWIETQNIDKKKDYLITPSKINWENISTDLPDIDNTDSWILGCLLGEGAISYQSLQFLIKEKVIGSTFVCKEVFNYLQKGLSKRGIQLVVVARLPGGTSYQVKLDKSSFDLPDNTNWIEHIITKYKRLCPSRGTIPEKFMKLPLDKMRYFLAGLLDIHYDSNIVRLSNTWSKIIDKLYESESEEISSDEEHKTPKKKKTKYCPEIIFKFSNKSLRNQICNLLLRLGIPTKKDIWKLEKKKEEKNPDKIKHDVILGTSPLEVSLEEIGQSLTIKYLIVIPANYYEIFSEIPFQNTELINLINNINENFNKFKVKNTYLNRHLEFCNDKNELSTLKDNNYLYNKIIKIEKIADMDESGKIVYENDFNEKIQLCDIEIPKHHNFLVQSVIVHNSEGMDIPKLDSLTLTTPVSDVEQAVGRVLRKDHVDKHPTIVVMCDSFSIFENQIKKRDKFFKQSKYIIRNIFVESDEINNGKLSDALSIKMQQIVQNPTEIEIELNKKETKRKAKIKKDPVFTECVMLDSD